MSLSVFQFTRFAENYLCYYFVKAEIGVRASLRNSTSEPSACNAIWPLVAVASEP